MPQNQNIPLGMDPPSCPFREENKKYIAWGLIGDLRDIDCHISSKLCYNPHPNLKDLILTEPKQGSTPLLVACDVGGLGAVRHIVEYWGADVNKAGCYYRKGEKIEGAFPLFVAASRGHERIVRYLLEKGAGVSARIPDTSAGWAGMTALHASVSYLHGDCGYLECRKQSSIIKDLVKYGADPSAMTADNRPIWMVGVFNASSTLLLVQLGMQLDQRTPLTGSSILHYWAGRATVRQSLEVIEFLLRRGVTLDQTDNYGLTPLLLAAIGTNLKLPNLPVLRYLIQQDTISLEDKVTALELAGATLTNRPDNVGLVEKGLQLWQKALELREVNGLVKATNAITTTIKEFENLEQLNELFGDVEECRFQSFLVRHRIYSSISSNAVRAYLWRDVPSLFSETPKKEEIGHFIDVNSLMLQTSFDPDDQGFWIIIINAIFNIVRELIHLRQELKHEENAILSGDNLLRLLRLVKEAYRNHSSDLTQNLQTVQSTGEPVNELELICQLIAFVVEYLPNDERLQQCLVEIVEKGDRDSDGRGILLVACRSKLIRRSLPTVRLLLHAGADPYDEDLEKNNALHLIAEKMLESKKRSEYPTVFHLIKAGVHLDQVDIHGRTARERVQEAFQHLNIQHRLNLRNVQPLPHLTKQIVFRKQK